MELYYDEPGFSPLRYWGSLYPIFVFKKAIKIVLVPFDIGVVYIFMCFIIVINLVLVPFDIGVVYIPSYDWNNVVF